MSATKLNHVVADFSASATGEQTIRLKDLRGQNVVLYFYPRDSTPGCTLEGREFAAIHNKLKRRKAVVLGVSRDSLASHEKFKAKNGLPFALISDPDEKLCRQFDVIHEKSLYGRKFLGVVRSTFLIGPDGKLRAEWRNVKVKGHAAEVLAAIEAQ